MRVLAYVPAHVRGAARTRRAVERDVKDQGHELVGVTDNPAVARAWVERGVVDKIAGRPEHLVELVDWALPVESGRVPHRIATGSMVAPMAWLLTAD